MSERRVIFDYFQGSKKLIWVLKLTRSRPRNARAGIIKVHLFGQRTVDELRLRVKFSVAIVCDKYPDLVMILILKLSSCVFNLNSLRLKQQKHLQTRYEK